MGQEAMHAILNIIDAPPAFRICSLNELAKKYLLERSKEEMFEDVKRTRQLVENLQHAFG